MTKTSTITVVVEPDCPVTSWEYTAEETTINYVINSAPAYFDFEIAFVSVCQEYTGCTWNKAYDVYYIDSTSSTKVIPSWIGVN